MSDLTRRDVLAAAAAIPVATTLDRAPLMLEELRVLAMCATPSKTWIDRQDEYAAERITHPGDDAHRIVHDLESRGLLQWHPRSYDEWPDFDGFFTPTAAGHAVLNRHGVST